MLLASTGSGLPHKGGFNFELTNRNAFLEAKGMTPPKTKKTGTTICGCVFKDGVVLGADTRATEGPIVCDKDCEKIHYIAPNIWCCGAGTSADTENSTGLISSQMELLRLRTGRETRVVSAMTALKRMLFKYQGHVSAALVLGGVDATGPHLYSIYPHGSVDKSAYLTMGSGSLAAMAVFEAHFKADMDEEEAKKLVHAAISSGIFNDLGSGSNVDLLVIKKDSVTKLFDYDRPNPRPYKKEKPFTFIPETTVVLRETTQECGNDASDGEKEKMAVE